MATLPEKSEERYENLRGLVRRPPAYARSHLLPWFAGLILVVAFTFVLLVGLPSGEQSPLPTYLQDHAFSNAAAAQALDSKGVDEERLRAHEEATLGKQHAAEHAKQREALKRTEAESVRPTRTDREVQTRSAALAPASFGSWAAPFPTPVLGINALMLPTSKVLLFAYEANNGTSATSRAWVWNPDLGTDANAFKRVDPPINPDTGLPANIWCAGNSFLADGRVLVTGGNLKYPGQTGNNFAGLNRAYTFNPWDETWTEQPQMRKGRWYPSQLLMPDGRTVIMQGLDESGTGTANRDLELFTPSSDPNGRGSLTNLGPPDVLNSPGQPTSYHFYPHMFWMPSGHGLVAGHHSTDTWYFNPPAAGTNPPLSWSDVPDMSRNRIYGNAVLLPGGPGGPTRVLETGGFAEGGQDAVNTSETINDTNLGAGWQGAAPMNIARSNHNTVLLPDRSLVAVGGGIGNSPDNWASTDALRQIELYDPKTKTWRLGPAQAENRAYHSTALLLPDGRVLSTGDDVNGGTDNDTAELYSPPYLFKGARPRISSAPAAVTVGRSFKVGTPDAVTRAVLIAPGAVTHATDMNQRSVDLKITGSAAGKSVTLAAPPKRNIAPPGYYMLFLLNSKGVPSAAKFIRVG